VAAEKGRTRKACEGSQRDELGKAEYNREERWDLKLRRGISFLREFLG